ncbi:MAG TPA: DinB family protein [Candidatus Limnocylindrales bacterium]
MATTPNGVALRDAFDHHNWATLVMLDACSTLTDEQLATTVPGTYGSILDTFRHLVGADSDYLTVVGDGSIPAFDEDAAGLPELRAEMVRNQARWASVLEADLDPDRIVTRHRDDGSESHAPLGIRLTQATQHGTDHRSQIATALTALGIEPPDIDVWAWAWSQDRLSETPAPA